MIGVPVYRLSDPSAAEVAERTRFLAAAADLVKHIAQLLRVQTAGGGPVLGPRADPPARLMLPEEAALRGFEPLAPALAARVVDQGGQLRGQVRCGCDGVSG